MPGIQVTIISSTSQKHFAKLTKLKAETDKLIIVEHFIIPLSVIDRATRERIWKI